ncbi:proteasome subunit beta type-6-like protein [Carex littledalei]|uniref:Proteasome subunit beta type-6-like protein n=1 Tax=Carex littledalei TaxID=544730 RepID=A0A833QK85_9POAL|nr:proteasome subunit beta type-6-like protein [Carex littledalei]
MWIAFLCRNGSMILLKAFVINYFYDVYQSRADFIMEIRVNYEHCVDAMARDGASGGVVRTVTINAEGVTRKFYGGDTLPLWHDELEPTNSLLDILSSSVPEPMST